MNVSTSSACPAVLLSIFNRPDKTRQVMEAIRKAHPPRLYIAADGPREGRAGEVEACEAARTITMKIDWPCEMFTLFRETNLGCKLGLSTAMDWFFEHESEGIILEDDTLPHPSFFSFCQTLLEYYRHDERVMEIGGGNYQFGRRRSGYTYYFSKYAHTWGWATWKRAWRHYDVKLTIWPILRGTEMWTLMWDDPREMKFWESIFDRVFEGQLDTWDYQWQLARWCRNGLSAVPSVNLVSNIGFGRDATHTNWRHDPLAQMPIYDIGEISHPPFVIRHRWADKYMFHNVLRLNLLRRAIYLLRRAIRKAENCWRFS
jgi:hypothetical protein